MKTWIAFAAACLSAAVANGQAASNWNTLGGDAQHSGWERVDAQITPDSVKEFRLLWKIRLENQPKGPQPLMPPIILGRLISYRGFKELAFVGSSSDVVYAIDADLGKIFWQKHLEYSTNEPQVMGSSRFCPGGMTAMPVMPPPAGRGGPAPPAASNGRSNGFTGGPASVYSLSSDGRLHRLNTSTGDDVVQPVKILPANARVYGLSMSDNVIYAVTGQGCNEAPDAVWAADLNADPIKVSSASLSPGASVGPGGPVIGSDGTVYVQTTDGLVALAPRTLLPKRSFKSAADAVGPVVFAYQGRDFIVSAGRDRRLYLLDSESLDRPVDVSGPLPGGDGAIWGGLSTWEDGNHARWVLAPVWRGLNSGSIVAFKVEDKAGKTALVPAWVSRDLSSPEPPVIAGGVVFAVGAGELDRQDGHPRDGTRATLYALDAVTGKELYSSRNLVNAPGSLTGITVANGRVYFAATDGTLYAFGIYTEH